MAASVPVPGYYVWEVPGKWITIELNLDLVDRLQQDVIRGFGSLPRRGAEVGGVLLGTVSGGGRIVRIEDYEQVAIEYRRGPSYLLSPTDTQAFEAALAKLRSAATNALRPVGYFRSHTREDAGLGEEDLDLIARNFPSPETIALLIRPFGTKPSIAGFYFKENGKFQDGPPLLEFPFRRRDLAPEDAPPPPERGLRRTPPSRIPREPAAALPEPPPPAANEQALTPPAGPVAVAMPEPPPDTPVLQLSAGPQPKSRIAKLWIPLSVVGLVAGVLLGFQLATSMGPHLLSRSDPYNLSLSATPAGNDLEVRWDRQSSLIQKAHRGVLTIEDGNFQKSIELDPERLQGSSEVVYRRSTNHVRFRFEVFLGDSGSVAQTVDWKQ